MVAGFHLQNSPLSTGRQSRREQNVHSASTSYFCRWLTVIEIAGYLPRNLSIALRTAQPTFHDDEWCDEWETDRREIFRLCRCGASFPIRADIDYVRRRFAFTRTKHRRFIEMRFFFSSQLFRAEPRSSVFCRVDLNCLLLTFRCFISSLACNH